MASRENAIKNNLNDRARKVGQFDELTTQDIDALIAFYDYSCLFPGCEVKPATSVDHVKSLSKGGTNTRDNLQLLCTNHNKAKGDEEIDYRKGRICPDDFTAPNAQEKTYKKHDWDSIQFEYVSTQKTYAQIAEQFQVHEVQLRKRAAEESWTEKREKFATNLLQDVTEMARKDLAKENFDVLIAGIRTFQRAVQRWEYDGSPATLREIVDLWKPLAAALGETTARTANVDETEFDDADIIEAAERVARRAERKAKTSDYLGSSESEAEFGAGWSD